MLRGKQTIRAWRAISKKTVMVRVMRSNSTSTQEEGKENKTEASKWIWETASAESNQYTEAIENCCLQLKRKRSEILPDSYSTIAFVSTGRWRPGNQLQHIPIKLEEEGIVPANRVFGGTLFKDVFGIPTSSKKFSLSVTIAHIPGVHFKQFHVPPSEFPRLEFPDKSEKIVEEKDKDEDEDLQDDVITNIDKERYLMMMMNGNDIDEDEFLPILDRLFPNVKKFGSVSIPRRRDEDNSFFFVNGDIHPSGGAGVLIEGDIDIDFVSSNGYFPLGKPFSISETHQQQITLLDETVPTEAIDCRLERYGYNAPATPVMYKIISKQGSNNLRENNTHVLVNSNMEVDSCINVGDEIQFYAYDYRRVIQDIGEKLTSFANSSEPNAILGYSSLLSADVLHKTVRKQPPKIEDGPVIITQLPPGVNPREPIGTKEPKTESAQSKQKKVIIEEDSDLYPVPVDIKYEIERIVKNHHKFPLFSGASTSRTILPFSENPIVTTSSVASLCLAIFKQKSKK